MKKTTLFSIFILVLCCNSRESCHLEMVGLLHHVRTMAWSPQNQFSTGAKTAYMDSLLAIPHTNIQDVIWCKYLKGNLLLELGREKDAIGIFESIRNEDINYKSKVLRDLALAYLRYGERSNCVENHAAESCIVPFQGVGVHRNENGSRQAIKIYEQVLEQDPDDLESRWLLNIAYMSLGEYPNQVPAKFYIPGMQGDTTEKVKPFVDIAAALKLNSRTMAGGSITEDFNNDGYIDIMISALYVPEPMQFFRNNGDGTFTDVTKTSGLHGITGGLNMMQTDYNNDGFKDIFVVRGGWQAEFGCEPNSLLRNNGDGTFTDVTTASGLLSFHPTQTATWNDFNNDGWLDVFIGNETTQTYPVHPCELYMNNQDGTFRQVSAETNSAVINYVKGVTSGDYNNDGWVDIFLSTMRGARILLKNNGPGEKEISFTDVSAEAGIVETGNTFPTWFWDYDNDGWLDIYACDYSFNKSLSYYTAAERLGIPAGNKYKMLLYHNNGDGTFTNESVEAGLNTNAFAMGANFGDIDNDGFLDMYLGTGNPNYQSLIPNRMFRNKDGRHFADVSASARVAHLQKGHGVSFVDLDNDGDQDIHIEMGGAYPGDAYENAMFANPGQNENSWINIDLVGTKSNKAAIGSRLVIYVTEEGKQRKIVRDVNSGGSFGSSPLRREIGLGKAKIIDKIEIQWRGSNDVEVFSDIAVNQFVRITQGRGRVESLPRKPVIWPSYDILCTPVQ